MAAFENFTQLVNAPLFHIGQTPVTLGGVGLAILIFVGSLFVSAVVQRIIGVRLSKNLNLSSGISYALQRMLHYLIICLGIVLAAQCIGFNLGSLAVAFGFLGVGVGFGLQNITSNFIAGLILLLERPIGVDDFVSVEGQMGTVVNINMRSTIIRTLDNVSIIVPNSKFVENPVINWSHGDPKVRIHCPVGVAYGSDVSKVKETLLSVARANSKVLQYPEPEVRFLEFGDSSLNFMLYVWMDNPEKQFFLHSEINYAIDEAFRKAGIHIPFPQRDLHLQMTPAVEKLAKRV